MADLVLDWSALGAYGTNLEDTAADAVTTTVDTGGVAVDITFTAQDDEAQAFTVTYDGYVPEGSGIDANSHLKLFGLGGDGGAVSPTSTTVLDFNSSDALYADAVQNVSFILNDVDGGPGSDLGDLVEYAEGGDPETSFQDYVTVLAYDAEGNATPVTITPLGSTTSADGGTATGDAITAFADQNGTLQVDIAGPVSRIEIVYENGGDATQGVLISDVSFSTVDAGDLPPVAQDDSVETPEDTAVIIDVLNNDSDPEGGALTVTSATATNGDVTINEDGTLTFTPDENYNGDAEISYTVSDPAGNTDDATVAVTVTPVNDDPVAVDDTVPTDAGTPVTFDPTDNDSDVDGDPLTGSVGDPDNGTITDNGDGTWTYTPDDGFTGEDTIPYTVDDGQGGSDDGVITVVVGDDTAPGDNRGPIAQDDFYTTEVDTAQTIAPLVNDTDPDGDALSVDSIGTPENGTLSDNGDGTWTYTPNAGFTGEDTISYVVSDGNGGTDDSVITINVGGDDTVPGGNSAPVAVDDEVGTDPATPVTFDPTANDTDADGDPLDISEIGTPDNGTLTDNGDGTYTYTPDDGFTGEDTIAYTVDDGQGGTDDGIITVTVGDDTAPGGPNTAPIAADDFYSTDVDTPQDIAPLVNDIDPNGDPLSVDTIGTPDNGTLTDNGDGTWTYTPDVGFVGEDTIPYTVSDGNGGTDDSVITINVGGDDGGPGGGNTAPTAVDDLYATSIYTSQTVDPTANDTDPEGDPLTITEVGTADFGTVSLNEDGTVTYTSTATPEGYEGGSYYDTFTYAITDGNGGTSEANVSIEVMPCFTPGTLIATPQGERLVEDLEVGDRVITRDNGIQEIRWIGNKELTGHQLARKPHLRPVLIQAGSLGKNLPEHDLLVSPNHRVLVANDKTALYFEEREVLAAAKHLTGLEGVDEVETMGVTYIHMMFDNHEVVLSNGAWTESFQPGDMTLGSMDEDQRQEIFELFPELEHAEGLKAYGSARRSLKKHEAQLLTK